MSLSVGLLTWAGGRRSVAFNVAPLCMAGGGSLLKPEEDTSSPAHLPLPLPVWVELRRPRPGDKTLTVCPFIFAALSLVILHLTPSLWIFFHSLMCPDLRDE